MVDFATAGGSSGKNERNDNVSNNAFAKVGLNGFLLEKIKLSGFITPTRIQRNGIPIISAGRDVMAYTIK